MGEYKTAEQAQDEYLKVLGPTLGPLYYALYNEVAWLHAKWKQYRILFAESAERVELLNRVAGSFFSIIQDVLFEDVVLNLARITEMPKHKGKDRLTIQQLSGAIQEPNLSREIKTLVKQSIRASDFVKDWRNRHLAHRDLALAVGVRSKTLPSITREKMERALAAMRSVMNRIEQYYLKSEVSYTDVDMLNDAKTLVDFLKIAVDTKRSPR